MTGLVGMAAAGDRGRGPRGVDERPYGVRRRGRAVALGLLALVAGTLGVVLAVVGLWLTALGGVPLLLIVGLAMALVAVWAMGASLLALVRARGIPGWTRVLAAIPAVLTGVLWVVVPQWFFGW